MNGVSLLQPTAVTASGTLPPPFPGGKGRRSKSIPSGGTRGGRVQKNPKSQELQAVSVSNNDILKVLVRIHDAQVETNKILSRISHSQQEISDHHSERNAVLFKDIGFGIKELISNISEIPLKNLESPSINEEIEADHALVPTALCSSLKLLSLVAMVGKGPLEYILMDSSAKSEA